MAEFLEDYDDDKDDNRYYKYIIVLNFYTFYNCCLLLGVALLPADGVRERLNLIQMRRTDSTSGKKLKH